ncbi:helix-turn-helix domain-containing protein [Kitasatospora sp. NPDC050543]|uniref:helix-turn-helix domain-containing protein n=1 Tax=Kitasatospora sp. NPDC050543 TaxID=3364054 RepID=UPI0037A548A5
MGLRAEISERQRRFGEELRRLRMAAGLSAPEMGIKIGMKGPAVSHTEAGRLGINLERLDTWLDACGCDDLEFRAALIAMGRSTGKGWWSTYKGVMNASALDLAESEAAAISLDSYETLLIPGLLQIEPYAEVILSGDPDKVRFRLDRQHVLVGPDAPPLHAVVHEAALHAMYGGSAVMKRQLDHLVEMSELPQVTIQILPFSCAEYASTDTTFMMLGGAHDELDTVLMEHPAGSVYLGAPEAIAAYREKFARLKSLALPPLDASPSSRSHAERDSWGLIQHIRYTL